MRPRGWVATARTLVSAWSVVTTLAGVSQLVAPVDLHEVCAAANGDGVHWTLPSPSELNANLVRLEPSHTMASHTNDAVDVLLVVVEGSGTVDVEGAESPLGPGTLVHLPKGLRRSITASADGLAYLTVHRRRALSVGPTRR